MRKILITIMVALLAAPAFAQMDKPQVIAAYIHSDTPYGEGTLRKLLLKVYDASVWTDAKIWSMESTFALSINYHLNFDIDELVGRSIEEMQHVDTLPEDSIAPYKAQLTKVFVNVKSGDSITALYVPKKGLIFYHNDQRTGIITDKVLAEKFISIWLSPKTSEPQLRQSLLGLHA